MANGKVIIETELDPSGFKEGLNKMKGMGGAWGGKGGILGGSGSPFGIGSFIKGFAGLKVVQAAWNGVSNSMGGAIDRFDTMNRFPKMMETMGYSAQDAQDSIDQLNQGVIGLPTALDTVVGTTQQLALMTGDLGHATDLTLALNNAFLASGATTGDASRGLTQFSQMLSRGEVDLISWRTLMETMPIALRQVADSFGLPEDDAYALYDALKSGDITFDEFTNRVIELSEATGGFADQAREASKGVKTSMENMGTAVVRGLEGVMSAVDDGLKSLTGKGISDWINTFASGIGKGFKVAEKGVAGFFNFIERFKPAFSEIGRVAGNAFQAVGRFFQPVGTFIREVGTSLSVFSELLTTTIGRISRGDWAGAWDSLTSNISGRFRWLSIVFRTTVADMWTNFKGLMDRFNNFDWSTVWNGLDNFFGAIQDQILQIDFKVVGNEIGTVIREFLDANIPKLQSFVIDVLLNPNSKLNIEAGEFHAQIMALFDGLVEGLFDIVIPAPLFSWERWDKAIADASQRMNKSIMDLISRGRMLLQAWENPNIEVDVMLDILLRRGQGWSEAEIKEYIDSEYGPGTYDAQIEVLPSLNIGEIDPTMLSSQIQAWFGDRAATVTQKVIADIEVFEGQGFGEDRIEQMIDDKYGKGFYKFATSVTADIEELELSGISEIEIEQAIDAKYGVGTYQLVTGIDVETKLENIEGASAEDVQKEIEAVLGNQDISVDAQVSMIIDIMEGAGVEPSDIEAYIDSQFPPGTYEKVIQIIAQIEAGFQQGMTEAEIQSKIDAIYGVGTYESIVNVDVKPNVSLSSGHSAGASMVGGTGLSGQIKSWVQSMVPQAGIPVDIKVLPNLALGGAGPVEAGGSSFDLSGITAQITAELATLQTTVNTAMGNINNTIMTQASLWGTTISTAMTTMVTSITATMTAMALAVTLVMMGMTIAVSMAMTSLSETVTQTMTSMAETVTQAMSDMADAITEAMNAMVEAVTAGMEEAVSAAESGAEGIVDAVSGLYDSMYSAGQSAGEGLADGLNSMQGAVRAAATALASAANVAAQAAFIINSPSKVWRGFGYSAGEGLVDGFNGSQRSVEKSATRLAMAGLPRVNSDYGLSYATAPTFRKRKSSVVNQPNNDGISQKIDEVISAIQNGQVIALDTGALVGGTANQMDGALGEISQLGGRHRL